MTPLTEEEVKQQEQQAAEKVNEAGTKAGAEAVQAGATPEEVQTAVEKARKEEKDKLYPQIEELKQGLKDVQALLKAEQDEKKRIKAEAEATAERERQSNLSETERTHEVLKRLEEQLNNEREERKKFSEELESRRTQDELNRYRTSVIEANKDEIIPELVQGRTEKEIDESLEIAKARFKEYADRFQQRQSERTRNNMPRSTNPDTELLEEEELSKDLTAIDTDRYQTDDAYRKQIQGELANEYSRLAGRR